MKSPKSTTPSKSNKKAKGEKEFETETENFGKLVWILKDKNKDSEDQRIREQIKTLKEVIYTQRERLDDFEMHEKKLIQKNLQNEQYIKHLQDDLK